MRGPSVLIVVVSVIRARFSGVGAALVVVYRVAYTYRVVTIPLSADIL